MKTRCMTGQWSMVALIVGMLILPVNRARAERGGASQHVRIPGDSGEYRIAVHPSYVTVLYFPSPVVSVLRSDAQSFTVQAKGELVVLRPSENAAPGTRANLNILTKTLKVTVLLEVAERPEDAVAQVVFERVGDRAHVPGEALAAKSYAGQRSLALGGMLGVARSLADSGTMISKSLRFRGVESRFTQTINSHLSYEASLAMAQMSAQQERHILQAQGIQTILFHPSVLARALAGGSIHRGTRFIPRVRAAGGVQGRLMQAPRARSGDGGETVIPAGSVESPWELALIASLGAGFDVRVHRDWLVSLGVNMINAIYSTEPGWLYVEGGLSVIWQ